MIYARQMSSVITPWSLLPDHYSMVNVLSLPNQDIPMARKPKTLPMSKSEAIRTFKEGQAKLYQMCICIHCTGSHSLPASKGRINAGKVALSTRDLTKKVCLSRALWWGL